MCTRTSISLHDGYRLGASICIAWNLSVRHNERKAIFWVLRKAKLSVCVPLEPLPVCIGAKRWERWVSVGEVGMVIVQWIELARIWHLYKANCCYELTCCQIKQGRA